MDAKLTLRLNQEVIKKAKEYAFKNKSSLSRLVENYLSLLVEEEPSSEIQISPFVKSISSGIQISTEIDERKAYREHLEDKYK